MAQWVQPLIGAPISHIGGLVQVPATPLPPTASWEEASSSSGAYAPAAHKGDPEGVWDPWLQPGAALSLRVI